VNGPSPTGPDSLTATAVGRDPARVALIERDRAWKLAAEAVASACTGHGAGLLLEGSSGIGKSGLLAAVEALARHAGVQVHTARGLRRETDFPFGVVLQLLGDRLPHGAGSFAGPEPDFARLHDLYRLFADLAATAPVALMVDDADLADPASLRFLLYLEERIRDLPITLVLTAGSVPARRAPELLREIARHPLTTRHRLEPLTRNGTARRVAKRWVSGAADDAVEAIHRASKGNSFVVDVLVSAIAEAEPAPTVDALAPAEVGEWALARALELDEAAPALLTAIAVLGPDCALRHVTAITDIDQDAALETVDTLMEAGILARGARLCFAQPAVAAAIERSQAAGARATLNLRAARLLASEEAAPERVAGHLLLAPRMRSGWVVDALCVAAAVALGRGAPAEAARYLRRALDEPPPRAKRAHVVLELGRAEAMAGDPQAAMRLRNAAEHLTETPQQQLAALTTGRALFGLGRHAEALAVFERGLEAADDAEPDLTGRLQAGRATALWLTERANGGKLLSSPPPAGADTPGDRALLALHAMEGAIRGAPWMEVRALAERALARGALLEDETADGPTYYLAAAALAFADDLLTAEAALTAAVREAESRGSVLGFATASHLRASVILMRGRLVDAGLDARHALGVERHGWRLGLGGARVVLASTLIEQGDLEGAQHQIGAAEALNGGADPFRLSRLVARGRLRILTGRADDALEDFLACGALADQAGITNPAVAPWQANAGRACAVIGDWDEARRLVESELSLATAFGAPSPVGRALRALASISEPGPALEALESAVETLQTSQAALDRATALVDFGAALRRSGKRRDARAPIKEGLELAQRCGATVLAARALREATAAGARPRRTALQGKDALTARERQVAALAAEGLSNREIAETLVVTIKTVEFHLKHSYRKLGVASRKQLRGILDAG
jgi:DNA-binding CsgD family transcriptional regulator